MKTIKARDIQEKVMALALRANTHLRRDVVALLKEAERGEKKRLARRALAAIIENAAVADRKSLAICQDTGLPIIFVELGSDVRVQGNINDSIQAAVAAGYARGYFRASIQPDPVFRSRRLTHVPAIIHTDIVPGNQLTITLMPKGFGSENKAVTTMLNPTAGVEDIEQCVVAAVQRAGAAACPPYIIGVGIGGTQDYAGLLAKKALLDPLSASNKRKDIAAMEQRLLRKINALGIGPCGLGGRHTALAVRIKIHPTHIAGLPVAVNISCHALRSATVTL
ncbi:MAG: fumarate hydratase [Candidatus Omnitrophica bacterium]|nr:fumarate hydratase [Candidatus Omnitrophota bacterium]